MFKLDSPSYLRQAAAGYPKIDPERRVCVALSPTIWHQTPSSELDYISLLHAGMAEGPTNATPRHEAHSPLSTHMAAMVRILKAQELYIHGAHIYHLGVPAILSLSSAYATGKITRGVFFDTLNLFVQHTCTDTEEPKGIKPHHLVTLGIPEPDASRLPLSEDYFDIWIVAGLFNGVIDMDDFTLLYGSDRKGLFLQRHFPDLAPQSPPLDSRTGRWLDDDLLVRRWSLTCPQFLQYIPAVCARMETSPGRYSATNHYLFRLAAAERKGEMLSVFGPFDSEEAMERTFADIFHVVEPDYQPSLNSRKELASFCFVEPPRTTITRPRHASHVQRDDADNPSRPLSCIIV